MTSESLFAGVDRAVFAVSFADRLRSAGVEVAFTGVERCTAAIGAVGAMSLGDLYWLTRISFVNRQNQLATFDAVFDAVFDTEQGQLSTPHRGQQTESRGHDDDRLVPLRRTLDGAAGDAAGVPWVTLPSVVLDEATDEDADATAIPELRPSSATSDMDRPFDLLDEAELERVGVLLESAITQLPQRRSRRRRTVRSRGPISMRRSLRRAMQTGGDVVTLLHTTPRRQPRPIVVLLDVSGSMESYSRAYLHLTRPLAMNHRAEVFAFATELTRITPSIRLRSPADAIEQISDNVGDRFSGTRLASSIATLLHHRTWNTTVRGAVVVVCSDGWDADPPDQLDRAMRRLSLLAHRVVWVNPRAAASEFEPRTGGMAAALPYCDHFLSGHTGQAMHDVIEAITAA